MEDHTDCEDIDSAGEDDDDGEQETYNIAGEWMDAPQKRSCSFFHTSNLSFFLHGQNF